MKDFTLVIPYYRNPLMLREQLRYIAEYPRQVHVCIVDDCSPEPAEPIVREVLGYTVGLPGWLTLLRIKKDKPWNRGMARNLGVDQAPTEWVVHVDIDHVLYPEEVYKLLQHSVDEGCAYRFQRERVGAADATRKKDKIPETAYRGPVHPHVDSYLIHQSLYWKAGGYNEAFTGYLGGGSEFLKRLERVSPIQLFEDIWLRVYTRHAVPDANDLHCSRNTQPGKAIWQRLLASGKLKPRRGDLLRQPWERVQ